MVAGAGEVAVVGGAFLVAMGRADARIHVEHDGPRCSAAMNAVDPLSGEARECCKILIAREPLGLEPPHLAGRCSFALDRLAADDPAYGRVARQPVGVVYILVSGKPTKHRLAQHAHEIMSAIPARTRIDKVLPCDSHQTKRVIKLAVGQQSGIGGDARTVELQLEAAVEIGPESIASGFTLWLRHRCPRSNEENAESYSSNGIGAGQVQ